jgi:hypothetical protein
LSFVPDVARMLLDRQAKGHFQLLFLPANQAVTDCTWQTVCTPVYMAGQTDTRRIQKQGNRHALIGQEPAWARIGRKQLRFGRQLLSSGLSIGLLLSGAMVG